MIFPLHKSCCLFGRLWGYAPWVNEYLADEVIAETAPCGAVRHGAECALDGMVLDPFLLQIFGATHSLASFRWLPQSHFGVGSMDLAIY